jgi:hypothetical protein
MNGIEQLIMATRTPNLGDPEAEWVAVGLKDGTLRLELDDGEVIDLPAGEVFALFAPPRANRTVAA